MKSPHSLVSAMGLTTLDEEAGKSKISKAFDEADTQNADQQHQIQVLKTRLANIQSRKRKKVELSPNSKFASIRDIVKSQKKHGLIQNDSSSSSDSEALDCIVVEPEVVE